MCCWHSSGYCQWYAVTLGRDDICYCSPVEGFMNSTALGVSDMIKVINSQVFSSSYFLTPWCHKKKKIAQSLLYGFFAIRDLLVFRLSYYIYTIYRMCE